jgi:hypothetical protein
MTVTIGSANRDTLANALAGSVDAGAGPGKVRIYSGARPANPQTAPGGTLLAEFTLNDPAFSTSAGGTGHCVLDVTPVPATVGVAAGTAAWARALDSDNVARFDGKCTLAGGGGDFIMSSLDVTVGLALQLVSGAIDQPLGTAD